MLAELWVELIRHAAGIIASVLLLGCVVVHVRKLLGPRYWGNRSGRRR